MNTPLVVFRADASLDIGTGHVMRCLTLAEALRARGATCRFVCRTHPGHLIDLVRQRGFKVALLPPATEDAPTAAPDNMPPAHAHWLGADWGTDAEQTRAALGGERVDWLVVDHYALDARWERRLRGACSRLMVIDDLADRPHDCDLLLDQNLGRGAADYAALVPGGCAVLTGPHYALLRPEFAALRPDSLARRESPQLKRLLITMGGVDKDNATGRVLDALRQCPLPLDCQVTVVMGPHAPWLDHVREQAAELPWPAEVMTNVSDMAQLMVASDFAIGAAGSTSWERCCLGLPSILLVLADNQRGIARALERAGAAHMTDIDSIHRDLERFFREVGASETILKAASLAAGTITDGHGADLVVTRLMEGDQA